MKAYPKYEVKLYEDKKEYWEIRKVTRENRVILNKNGDYITLSNVKELDNKIIREKSKKKK
ncbi:hypothetical protein J14TS2_52220 [Bacillus sp. J14TS2]|nr:hypothetical protein J14TS2_52220 [Bacillus sp. J14TS2]